MPDKVNFLGGFFGRIFNRKKQAKKDDEGDWGQYKNYKGEWVDTKNENRDWGKLGGHVGANGEFIPTEDTSGKPPLVPYPPDHPKYVAPVDAQSKVEKPTGARGNGIIYGR